jgi:hypothetical protein
MILENLSRIEHVPSTQFHDRPSDPEAPEEVSLIPLSIPCFNLRSLFFSMFAHLRVFLHYRKRRTWTRGHLSAADYGVEELMTLIQRILTT